jgi:hypothetical protein
MNEPGELFEHLRRDLFKTRWFWSFAPNGKLMQQMLVRLKLLMSCLEDIGRVRSYQLRIQHAQNNKTPEFLEPIPTTGSNPDVIFVRIMV